MEDKKELQNLLFKMSITLENQVLEEAPKQVKDCCSLVRGKLYDWKKLSIIQRMYFMGLYLETTDKYKTFTLRLSNEKMNSLETIENKADYFRRLISSHCQRRGYKIPSYAFVMERCPKGFLHLHGIINYRNIPENDVRYILKCVAFSGYFQTFPINKYILKIKPLKDSIGWLSYMFKSNKNARKYVYLGQELIRETKQFAKEKKYVR